MNLSMRILVGDAVTRVRALPSSSVDCVVTSPPYFGLRDYGIDGQFGREKTIEAYIQHLVDLFRDVRRVLKADGTFWLIMGDSYAKKILLGTPWFVAQALSADGWYLRQDIIWAKPNAIPESVRDRCTRSHDYVFLFSKSKKYRFDADAIREPCRETRLSKNGRNSGHGQRTVRENAPAGQNELERWYPSKGRNKRDVWTVAIAPFPDAHEATFPPALIQPCILAGAPPGGVVLDPFLGAGTTGMVALANGRECIGIELNPAYAALAADRVYRATGKMPSVIE